VSRKLEYRAQLVAVCEAWDPRVPLVSILRAAESAGGGPTPHAAAYRELLSDMLRTLDREVERRPAQWPELDPDHVLAHQLHWLPPEKVRRLARLQARREGPPATGSTAWIAGPPGLPMLKASSPVGAKSSAGP
jgi:hypothetical protein